MLPRLLEEGNGGQVAGKRLPRGQGGSGDGTPRRGWRITGLPRAPPAARLPGRYRRLAVVGTLALLVLVSAVPGDSISCAVISYFTPVGSVV